MFIFLILFNLILTPTANALLQFKPDDATVCREAGKIPGLHKQAGTRNCRMSQDIHLSTESVQSITGLEAISEHYDALLVDAWGVLHDGGACYAGVKACLRQFSRLDKPVIVLSNAARRHDAMARDYTNR